MLRTRFCAGSGVKWGWGDLSPGTPPPGLWENTLERQFAFLSGFLGGPSLYARHYGPPRLRARHLPFAVTPERARQWLGCMAAALEATPEIGRQEAAELLGALGRVAAHMVNTPDG
ncbi:MAG: globin [Deinococcus sp.]